MNKSISFAIAVTFTVGAAGFTAPTTGYGAIPVVTTVARKRSESVQEVPISIEAFSAEDIQRQNMVNVADLAVSTPGLSIEQQGAGGFITPVIRGMAQNVIGTDQSYDNNVGIFVNGVYQSGRNAVDMDLIGIERIEVARGPQSALYGRSTFAGAINYIYANPTDEFQADVSTTLGSDQDYGATLDVGGPLSEAVGGRLSAGYRNFDGTFGNKAGGDNVQGYESKAVAGALVFDISDAFTATFNILYSDRTNDQDAQFLVGLNCGDDGGGTPTYYCGELSAVGDVDISGNGFADTEVQQYSLNLDYDMGDYTLTSLTSFTETDYMSVLDRDYGSLELGTGLSLDACAGLGCLPPPTVLRTDMGIQSYAHSAYETRDISQEFRITSETDGALSWMAGIFLYKSETSTETRASLGNRQLDLGAGESYTGFFAPPFLVDDPFTQSNPFNIFDADTKAWAIFGQVEYDLSDTLALTAEVRYTDEEKEAHITYNLFPVDEMFKRSFDYTSPRLTLSFTPADDQLFYASLARGVRTGGINPRVTSIPADQAAERFFEPEDNWTFEIGSKTTLMDDRLLINTAIYYTEWEDMQLPALNSDLFGTHVTNVDGGADVWGLEIEGTMLLTDNISVNAGYAYTNPEFQSGTFDGSVISSCGMGMGVDMICTAGIDSQGRPSIDVSGKTLGRTAEHQANVGLLLEGQLGDSGVSWYWQSNANYQSENYARSINTLEYGERILVNMRAAIFTDEFELALWGKNIFDDEYVSAQALQPGLDGNRRIDAYQGNGRRYGLTATWRF